MFKFNRKVNPNEINQIKKQKTDLSLSKKIEAILFYKAEEVSISFFTKFFGVKENLVLSGIEELKENLKDSALGVIVNNKKVALIIKKDYSKTISELQGEEKSGELSAPALETLAIILYKGPISKVEIDEIRGVNSSYILRNLLVRGLIERTILKGKSVYLETIDLMRFLGIQNKEQLPAFEKVVNLLNKIESTGEENIFEADKK